MKKNHGPYSSAMPLALGVSAQAQRSGEGSQDRRAARRFTAESLAESFQQQCAIWYVEGKNIVIEYRYAEGKVDRLPNLAEELVRLNVDVIWGTRPSSFAC